MKKIFALVVAFAASSTLAAVVGTPHDLTALPGNTASSACQYCHMPHHSNALAPAGAPLWAKAVRTAYAFYPATISGTAQATAIGPVSQACLSCHDGTANAVTTQHNSQTLATNYTINSGATGGTNVGSDLSNDHPVSIAYTNAAPNRAALVTQTAAETAGFVFFNTDKIECGTCHDPHNQNATLGKFLRGDGSDFCARCHNK